MIKETAYLRRCKAKLFISPSLQDSCRLIEMVFDVGIVFSWWNLLTENTKNYE